MPPRRINDDYMDVDSDSDVSILGDGDSGARNKTKGKGKAVDRGNSAKAKGKAKEVSIHRVKFNIMLNPGRVFCSNHTLGRLLILVLGIPSKKTRLVVYRVQ